jgi:hypothetical protein
VIPSDASYYKGHYYKVYNISKSWTEAKEYCEELGGHLATITSSGEQNKLTKLVKKSTTSEFDRWWLGGTDEEEEGNWKWITGEKWSYTNWESGIPNNSYGGQPENYLEIANISSWIHQFVWNDMPDYANDDFNMGFVCEWESGQVDLSKATVTTAKTSYAYTGKKIKPAVTVKLHGKELEKGTDYKVTYVDNKNPGVATVIIVGKGDYTGTTSATFKIKPGAVSGVTAKSDTAKTLTVKWNTVSRATGYQVQYASGFGKKKTVKTTASSKTLKKLTSKKSYSVRVRAYVTVDDVTVYGPWSDVDTYKVK